MTEENNTEEQMKILGYDNIIEIVGGNCPRRLQYLPHPKNKELKVGLTFDQNKTLYKDIKWPET